MKKRIIMLKTCLEHIVALFCGYEMFRVISRLTSYALARSSKEKTHRAKDAIGFLVIFG